MEKFIACFRSALHCVERDGLGYHACEVMNASVGRTMMRCKSWSLGSGICIHCDEKGAKMEIEASNVPGVGTWKGSWLALGESIEPGFWGCAIARAVKRLLLKPYLIEPYIYLQICWHVQALGITWFIHESALMLKFVIVLTAAWFMIKILDAYIIVSGVSAIAFMGLRIFQTNVPQ